MTLKEKIEKATIDRIIVGDEGAPFIDAVEFGYRLAIEELKDMPAFTGKRPTLWAELADFLEKRWTEEMEK